MPTKRITYSLITILALVAIGLVRYFPILQDRIQNAKETIDSAGSGPFPSRITSSMGNFNRPEFKIDKSTNDPRAHQAAKIQAAQFSMNQPLQLFARIVDQDGQTGPGVKVQAGLAYFPRFALPAMGWSTKDQLLMSDEHGEFSIEQQSGVLLTIENFEKAGYRFEGTGSLVVDNRGAQSPLPRDSSPNNRVIIRAWKERHLTTRVKEGMVHVLFKPNGEFVSIDFDVNERERLASPSPPTGDLYVSILARAKDENGKYDWKVTLRAVGGGIQEHDGRELFPYVAPEGGYLPEWTRDVSHTWPNDTDAQFYVRSRDGTRYSEVYVHLFSDWRDGSASASVRYRTNLDGAREVYF